MIPIGQGEIPATGTELADRVSTVINGIIKGGTPATVTSEMNEPSKITSFRLGVTEAELGAARVQRPAGFTRLGTAEVGTFVISGKPARVFGAPVDISIEASHLPMSWCRDDKGNIWLVPAEDTSNGGNTAGRMELTAEVTQLEKALEIAVARMAEQNGAKLKNVKLTVEGAGPRALAARIEIAATKFMMTAKVALIAELALDDQMNLRVGRLEATGDGAAGGMLASMLESRLKDLQGKEVALGRFAFSGAALQDVQLTIDDRISLVALFGKS